MIKPSLLFFIILLLKLHCTACFNCSSVTSFEHCRRLQGCSWDPILQCQGSFSPPCFTTNCYYIDSSSGETTFDGTLRYPLKTLSDGFKKLSSTNGILIIINYQNNTIIQVTEAVILSTNITIMPLFTDHDYTIDFNQFSAAATSSYTSIITVSKQLNLVEATFQNISLTYPKLRIFMLKAGTLNFYKVNINNITGPVGGNQAWQIVYDSTVSSTKPSNFCYLGGKVTDTSARFVVNGPSLWERVQFSNYRGNILLSSSMSFPIKFKNCYFLGGAFTFLQAVQANITIESSIFTGSYLNLFNLEKAKQVLILNSTFENISLFSSDFAFLSIKPKPIQGYYIYLIQDTLFKNMTTPYPLISLSRGDSLLSLIRIQMENIKRNETFNELKKYQQIFGSMPFGICCISRAASLSIVASNFTSISSDCFGIKESKLSISSSNFNNSALTSDLFLSKDSETLINKKSGVTWIKIEGISTSIADGDKILLQKNIFTANHLLPLYGGVLSFKGAEQAQVIAESNQFIGNSAVYGGVFYLEGVLLGLSSKNNQFINNSALNGGAIYKISNSNSLKLKTAIPSISTENDIFLNNTAIGNGGGFFLDLESLKANNTQFIGNKAENGGAIYFINLDQSSQNHYGSLSNLLFLQNIASNFGGALKLFFDYSELKEDKNYPSVFEKNQDIETKSLHTSRPSYFQFLFYDVITVNDEAYFPNNVKEIIEWINNPQNTRLARTVNISQELNSIQINQKSGQTLSQIMSIQVIDNKGNLANYIDGEKIHIEMSSFENKISEKTPEFFYPTKHFIFEKGYIFVFHDFRLEGEPKTKAFLNLKSESTSNGFLKDANLSMNQTVEIDFVDCTVGEIFNKRTRTCDPCQENSFSLGNPYTTKQCEACLPNAKCLGGAKIAPDPGYWRFNNQTIHIFQSQISEASRGGFDVENGEYNPQAVCISPYTGAKCDECIQGYASLGSRKGCFSCSNPFYHILFLMFFLIQLGVIFYLLKAYLLKRQTQSSGVSVFTLIKIIINFIQVVSMLFELQIEFPDSIYNLIWGFTKIIPLGKDGFFTDCYLKMIFDNDKYVSLAKIIGILLIQPLIFWALLIFLYQIYSHFQMESGIKQIILLSLMAIGYVIYPFILQTFFEIFKCQNFTPDLRESNEFMQNNPSVKCYSYDHWIWNILPGIISILIWLVIISYFFLKKLKNVTFRNFLCKDLRQNKQYWEVLIFLRKLMLMLIIKYFDKYSSGLQAFIAIIFLHSFFLLQWRCSPYKDRNVNTAEFASQFSSLSIMVLLLIASFSQQHNEYPRISYFTSVLISTLILSFYLRIIFIFKTGWHVSKKRQVLRKQKEKRHSFKSEQSPIENKSNEEKRPHHDPNQRAQKTSFVIKLQPILSESASLKLITSIETQRSEDSHLLSSPLISRGINSPDFKTKDQNKEF